MADHLFKLKRLEIQLYPGPVSLSSFIDAKTSVTIWDAVYALDKLWEEFGLSQVNFVKSLQILEDQWTLRERLTPRAPGWWTNTSKRNHTIPLANFWCCCSQLISRDLEWQTRTGYKHGTLSLSPFSRNFYSFIFHEVGSFNNRCWYQQSTPNLLFPTQSFLRGYF